MVCAVIERVSGPFGIGEMNCLELNLPNRRSSFLLVPLPDITAATKLFATYTAPSVWAAEEWLVEHAKPLDESRGPDMQAPLPPGLRRAEASNNPVEEAGDVTME